MIPVTPPTFGSGVFSRPKLSPTCPHFIPKMITFGDSPYASCRVALSLMYYKVSITLPCRQYHIYPIKDLIKHIKRGTL